MKTVAEIAAEMNVNVQTVYRRLNKVKQKSNDILTEKIDGITYFTEVGEKLIIESLTSAKQQFNTVKHSESSEILFLREQITSMNAEKAILLEQIDKLTETIKIQAESIKTETQNQLAETFIDNQKLLSNPTPEKVGLWAKIFKKKK